MSVIVTVQVTKSPVHLDQIENLVIQNITDPTYYDQNAATYRVVRNGQEVGRVYHNREAGALSLIKSAIELILERG